MANVRAPNRDFTLGTAGNRIQMSSPVNPVAGVVIAPHRGRLPVPQPSPLTLSTGGDGSVPIAGYGYGSSG